MVTEFTDHKLTTQVIKGFDKYHAITSSWPPLINNKDTFKATAETANKRDVNDNTFNIVTLTVKAVLVW